MNQARKTRVAPRAGETVWDSETTCTVKPPLQRTKTRLAFPGAVKPNVAQPGDALELLKALPDACTPLVFLDPQYRGIMDKMAYGNEGARQSARAALPQMADKYIDACCREIARLLRPSGYLMLWADTFNVCEGNHLRIKDVLPPVDLIDWINGQFGMGPRSRRCGSYLVVLQKAPIVAKATWPDRGTRDRWFEKIIKPRSGYPHRKPPGLIKHLIECLTNPGDLIVDPAAGSFVVMHAAHELGRDFVGCDLAYDPDKNWKRTK
jgi:site-specific DNA-methyltransferase (adenine-specific)